MKRALGIAIAIVIVVVLGALGWFVVLAPGPLDFAGGQTVPLAEYKEANPTGVPGALANAGLIERGEYLAQAGDCAACHTVKGGKPFAGGFAFKLPFGTLYSSNITPDKETGIGAWSDADFLKAVHQGVAPDGTRLYPAFPYAAYTLMTDEDVLAIKAYLFSLPPVRAATPPNTLSFPFNQRWLMAFWSAFFNPNERYRPNTAQSAEWNRGAYIAEAMGHCGDCHTPRNPMQAMDHRRKFMGAVAAGWKAYNLTPDKETGVGAWSDETLAKFISTGHVEGYGTASGPMGEAIDNSLRHLKPEDIKALVVYLRTVPPISDPALPAPRTALASASPKDGTAEADARGAELFAGACVSCHGWTGKSPVLAIATFTGARAVNDPSARNVAQAIVWGVTRETPSGPAVMPAFGHAYSNTEIAAIANYVTKRFGAVPSAITADQVAELRGQASQ
ncbi:c-type cytochrome [Dongia sedimenti]|uniref:C-type cytochrome n=1 Tax=Dongia sedimenti TaxID=3064282 RepID=A0ABU0YMT5_9PROT|nr:c-type cytochrome [Rhodospirillaceae bacterium R-7]